ncbi:uncharacterized protein PHACADRAFT_246979, partial [Phanerochaete carnosa HHB-10118-sp]
MPPEASGKAVLQGVEGPPDYDQPATVPSRTSSETHTSSTESKSGIVKRAMERTADKLHRSKSSVTGASLSQSQPLLPAGSHKRHFSRGKKGKERLSADGDGASRSELLLHAQSSVHRA